MEKDSYRMNLRKNTIMRWDNQTLQQLLELKTKTRQSYEALAESQLGDKTLGEALKTELRAYKKQMLYQIPEPEPKLFMPELIAPQENTLVIADLHAPYQNKQLLDTAIRLALSADVKHVDIAGDLHDFNSLSNMNKGEPTTVYTTDIAVSKQILITLAYYFAEIRITSGNHDEYWVKKKGGTFKDLIYTEVLQGTLANQIFATDYDYLLRGDDWLIGHLSSYDEEPGALASKLSDKYSRNVLVGHDHVRGHKRGIGGKLGVSIGAMLTPDRFWYKNRRINTFPDFQLGFALIINNELYLFSDKGNTDYLGRFYTFEYWLDFFSNKRYLEMLDSRRG